MKHNNTPQSKIHELFGDYDILTIWHTDLIVENYKIIKNQLENSSNQKCSAVIKNNMYGAPMEIVLPKLLQSGCENFFVANLIEGIDAQKIFHENISGKNDIAEKFNIFVLHAIIPDQVDSMIQNNLYPCINTFEQLLDLNQHMKHKYSANSSVDKKTNSKKLKCILHIDSGMSRHGISLQESEKLSQNWNEYTSNLEILYYMTHFFGVKEDLKFGYNTCNDQVEKFNQIISVLPPRPVSLSATDGTIEKLFNNDKQGQDHFTDNLARVGIGLIGGVPSEKYLSTLHFPIEIYTKISSISHVPAGNNIGYGIKTYDEDKIIGIINMGYGDGLMKILTGDEIFIKHPSQNNSDGSQNASINSNWKNYHVKIIAINLNCSIVDLTHLPEEYLSNYQNLIVEICGQNSDMRKYAVRDGSYQIFSALGFGSKNIKKIYY
jgi:alanine racemase